MEHSITRSGISFCCFTFFVFFVFFPSMKYGAISGEGLPEIKTMYIKDILNLSKAADMRSFMNTDESPCFDFYEFACGNWAKINPATGINGKLQTGALDGLKSALDRKIIKILNGRLGSDDTHTDRKMKSFFQSCMTSSVNRTEFLELLSEYGTMPALVGDAWNEHNFDWVDMLASVKHNYGLQLLIGLDVGSDLKQGTINRIFIGQPTLKFLKKSFYLENSGLEHRIAYRAEVAWHLREYLGMEGGMAFQIAEEIVGFEILLANGLLPDKTDLSNESLIVETNVEELQKKYGFSIDFKRFFFKTLGSVPNGTIYVFVESYLENLKTVLDTTNQRLLANYMFYMLLKEFLLPIGGTQQVKQKFCMQKIRQNFAEHLENMAYRRLNIAASEEDIKTIWIALKKRLKAHIFTKTLHWMTPAVREYAEQKLNEVSIRINSYENRNFSEYYDELIIENDDFLGNMKRIFELNTKHTLSKINQPVTASDNMEYFSILPFTSYPENTIKVPVVLLQPYVIWAANYPTATKFGTLGFLIARELIHNIGDKGRLYNKQGEMKNWWDEATTNAFMVERECFVEQYPQRFYSNTQLPNIDLQSENIADNGGLKLAFNAFVDWKKKTMLDDPDFSDHLPNLNYTDEQLFYLSFAQLWCNDIYSSVDNFQANRDQHTPGKFRVNGAVLNSEEFAITYNCSAESAMSPPFYCELF